MKNLINKVVNTLKDHSISLQALVYFCYTYNTSLLSVTI